MTLISERRIPVLPANAESAAFYEAAAKGRFLMRRCIACGQTHWYPRAVCSHCFGETVWEQASGHGTIYSYSVMRRADPPFSIAYVTLAEGPTMMTPLVDCDLDALRIGMAVQLVFKPSEEGRPVPCFRPV